MFYREFLGHLHAGLQPEVYLEIGIDEGDTLLLSTSRTIGIDPAPKLRHEVLSRKPWLKLYCQPSDEFFAQHSAEATLEGLPLDLAFIDGLHEFTQVVRDLANVERWGHPGTVVVIHDVLPENVHQASHAFREGGWTGDVWRVVSFLGEHRPDLTCRLVDARHSGVLVVTGLDPSQTGMVELATNDALNRVPDGPEYECLVERWLEAARPISPSEALRELGVHSRPHEAGIASTVDRGMRVLPETAWRPIFQRSIDAFYEGALEEGTAACLTLLNEPALPPNIRELTIRNQTFYARSLVDLIPGARWQALDDLRNDGAALRDHSYVVEADRPILVVREDVGPAALASSTLPLEDAGLLEFDVLAFPAGAGAGPTMSDVRPFSWQGAVYLAAVMRDGDAERTTRGVVMQLRDGELIELAGLGPRAGHFRQGWSPVITPDGPRFIAWWEPTEVFQLDEAMAGFERVGLRLAPHLAEGFRGGSQGVVVPGGYLFLVNEAATFEDGNEVAFSRFVRTDDAFQIDAVSPQFFVADRGNDVATGLARQGEQLVAGFASAGGAALLARIDLGETLNTLLPVAAPGRSARLTAG
ncbi:MAG: class I SAM-dependent methyltransferase [Thermomicrobiales bacterium]